MAGKKFVECIYCGNQARRSRDHVPSKTLIPDDLREAEQLITVPSCGPCNQSQARDEEYFKSLLAMHPEIPKTPEGRWVMESVKRQIGYGRGPARALLRTARKVELTSEAGLYLGDAYQIECDEHRLARVACRVVEGLFFDRYGWPLREKYDVDAWTAPAFDRLPDEARNEMLELLKYVLPRRIEGIAQGCLKVRHAIADDDPGASLWVLDFYGALRFVVSVFTKDDYLALGAGGGEQAISE